MNTKQDTVFFDEFSAWLEMLDENREMNIAPLIQSNNNTID